MFTIYLCYNNNNLWQPKSPITKTKILLSCLLSNNLNVLNYLHQAAFPHSQHSVFPCCTEPSCPLGTLRLIQSVAGTVGLDYLWCGH